MPVFANGEHDPRLDLPNPMSSGFYRSIPLAAVILSLAVVAVYWGDIPQNIPIRFNTDGQPVGYGSRWLLWIIGGINLAVFWLMEKLAQPRWSRYNYPVVPITRKNAVRQYAVRLDLLAQVRLITTVILSYLFYAITFVVARGQTEITIWPIFALLMALLLVVCYQIYRSLQAT